ncbi:beta-ketoacyl synthase [Flavobacterium amniphilum]|uniref:beta-ketoacyl synthase N-terminal-like domain-containing protein n=1 Tax=Flavobacterium amniphilum TaxID=1834035 RepID=UPI00202A5381|nr:beta-ketoacyl synthase N-terminal-like domain-containing protein [Flavobacterium amniphilum]MCL9803913.1 beta-ketoacyl synthase [Flavobacterium amniphilum]
MKQKIAITALSSVSALGHNPETIWNNYINNSSFIGLQKIGNQQIAVAQLPSETKKEIEKLRQSEAKYKNLDPSVLFAVYTSREAVKKAGWSQNDVFGINIGSSRGATELFEKYHQEFIETGMSSTLASPTTTLGNISSWVAHDLKSKGPEISHSITCSTALHAFLNGVVWLKAGMAEKFLVGGSEAPLTPFTIAQMQALKIYSQSAECRSFDLEKTKNTMILGEGASMICLETGENENALAYVEGIGYATDILEHSISISTEAQCFQDSMKMAMGDIKPEEIDAVVMHAPGTVKGDLSEYKAIQRVFGSHMPMLTTNKWKIGHTFGASGMLSVELALLMLQHNTFIRIPFASKQKTDRPVKKVMVNAVGFGGNAVSVLIGK